jgi:hypothetical protein
MDVDESHDVFNRLELQELMPVSSDEEQMLRRQRNQALA